MKMEDGCTTASFENRSLLIWWKKDN